KMNFECGKVFHIYTRANSNKDLLFKEKGNYIFFLKKYNKYLTPIFQTFCYCLLPNHYHFLIKVKESEKIFEYQTKSHYKYLKNELKINNFIQQQISNLHNSYAKAFNRKYNRRGSLFQRNPRSKNITTENYLIRASRYIHRNPIKHNLVSNLLDWKYSSYPKYMGVINSSFIDEDFIFSYFSSKQDLMNFTNVEIDDYEI
ncbi:MAG: hypothetical protein U9P73_02285, partial [Candidatus Cloacimonadota bacterium]|nr:hypothetical protein [Candidatus Cloacimonadota bacterium]